MNGERRKVRLRAGVRVRVRPDADNPHAGQEGVVLFAGEKACDVKFSDKNRRRSKGRSNQTVDGFVRGPVQVEVIHESEIDTILREYLESTRRNVDLVRWLRQRRNRPSEAVNLIMDDGQRPRTKSRRRVMWALGLAAAGFVVASVLFWLAGGQL